MVAGKIVGRLRRPWREAAELKRREDAWPAIQRGRELIDAGDDAITLKFLAETLRKFPENAELRFLYASVLKYSEPEKAASEALKAIELDPREPTRLTRIAYLFFDVKKPKLARLYADRAKKLTDADFVYATELSHLDGHFALESGDVVGAEERYRRSVEREPESQMFAVDLAKLLKSQGRSAEALEVVERALQRAKFKNVLIELRGELALGA